MTAVTYTARRGVQSSHSIGIAYSLDLTLATLSPTTNTINRQSIAVSGVTQNVIHRREKRYKLSCDLVEFGSPEWEDLYEFAESIDQFEEFIFDELGSVATPNDPQTAILLSNYKRDRVSRLDWWKFNFEIRILP